MKLRTYSDLRTLRTFEERYQYLRIKGLVGEQTFGFDRYLNQKFYHSLEWKRVRNAVILRDNGCDLGVPGYEIHRNIMVHHMNPVRVEDLRSKNFDILDKNFLISVSFMTHQAIHYGDKSLLPQQPIVRSKGDTKLW